MGIIKKVLKNAPMISIYNYLRDGNKVDIQRGVKNTTRCLKFCGHLVYGVGVLWGLEFYAIFGLISNEWNPLRQKSAMTKLNQEEIVRQEDYNNAWKKLFGQKGLVDRDNSGYISYGEQFDAWNKMGLINSRGLYFESDGNRSFPTPTRENLEKAIQRYLAEK